MQTVIFYAGTADWPRHSCLAVRRLAGSNAIGHVVNQLRDAAADRYLVFTERDAARIESWFARRLPQVKVTVQLLKPGLSPIGALVQHADLLNTGPLLLAQGHTIAEADYRDLAHVKQDLLCYMTPPPGGEASELAAAGVFYVRSGADLQAFLNQVQQRSELPLSSLADVLEQHSWSVAQRQATLCLNIDTPQGLLAANARLLGLGYGSEDAIERSYVEDFTVIPPVFLHETAVIENSVIGPFANVEAGAVISNSVVRNSLIDRRAHVENVVLDGALIGDRASVRAKGTALAVEEDEDVAL